MNTLIIIKNPFYSLLLSTYAVGGVLWLVLLFVFCFLAIHLGKYVYQRRTAPPPSEPEKPPVPEQKEQAPTSQEPVYYIVEKKKRRAKPQYSEPKEIRFK